MNFTLDGYLAYIQFLSFGEDMYVFLLNTYLGGELRGQKLWIRSAFVHSAWDTTRSRV